MTYSADLTRYKFRQTSEAESALNVGWLSRWRSFHTGPVDQSALEKLLRLCQEPVNRTRGWHRCLFCGAYPAVMSIDGESITLGDAEIRVPGRDGKLYAAPTLICHYIDKHRYCPPQEFLDAVTGLAK
jgi:hypothetical protein